MDYTKDLTKGSIVKGFLLFSLPLFGGSLFQQLYSTADLLFVGNAIGKTASAAVGSSSILVSCLIGLLTGISVGASVVVSYYAGAKDERSMREAVSTAILSGIAGGAVLMIVALVFARVMLVWLNTPAAIMDEAAAWLQIYFLAMIPMVLYNMCSGILRAMGDARAPFYVLAVGGILNVAMDALFILVLSCGVRGAAIATLISQTFTALVLFYRIKRQMPGVFACGICVDKLKRIIRLGLPVGIQSMLLTLSNVAIQYYINGFGEDAVAAFSIYHKAESMIYLPLLAFGQAMTTFTGQNAGAEKWDRIKRGIRVCNLIAAGVIVLISFTCLIFAREILWLFCRDEQVIAIGIQIMHVSYPFYFLYCLQEVTGGVIRGLGKSMQSMAVIVIDLCVIRVLLLEVFTHFHNNIQAIAAVYPATWLLAAFSFFFCWRASKGKI